MEQNGLCDQSGLIWDVEEREGNLPALFCSVSTVDAATVGGGGRVCAWQVPRTVVVPFPFDLTESRAVIGATASSRHPPPTHWSDISLGPRSVLDPVARFLLDSCAVGLVGERGRREVLLSGFQNQAGGSSAGRKPSQGYFLCPFKTRAQEAASNQNLDRIPGRKLN